jgi:hypothetical protein
MRVFFPYLLLGVALVGCNETTSPPAARAPAPAVNAPVSAPANDATVRNTVSPDRTTSTARTGSADRTAADNTAVNRRDADANTKTPVDQKENQADINVTAKIRRQVLDVKDLSTDAHNTKIITADGKVTLRGPVQSTEERDTLDRIARDVAGEGNVDNQLEVANSTATTNHATANPRR